MSIEPLSRSTLVSAIRLVNRAFSCQPFPEWAAIALPLSLAPQWVKCLFGLRRLSYWVDTRYGDVIAISGLYIWAGEPQQGWIGWTVVAAPWRRLGIGGRLLDTVLNVALLEQCNSIRVYLPKDLETSRIAQEFYRNNGFHFCGKINLKNGRIESVTEIMIADIKQENNLCQSEKQKFKP